ncbi:HNH endonuclease signature motif containing protein [Nocardioides alcanivorans]|uniref:HNH endonuclease signature motif containing protein n=1 Tax=Nocardioides alcanivorans TaxID=2897352 RepID=UPI001F327021|nr:HNH endonuclease signature motif containing protein [Nocardioides alcanivorans]
MIEIDARHQPYEVSDLDGGTLLGFLAEDRVVELKMARKKLRLAYQWAIMHPPSPDKPKAVVGDETLFPTDCEQAISGDGTPDVALFAVEELAASAGISRGAGFALVADALDLVHRLPLLWAKVEALAVPGWNARRVALLTRKLSYAAARWFDDHLAATGLTGWPTIEKWLAMAIAKFHPELIKDPTAPKGKADWGVWLHHPHAGHEEGAGGVAGTSELQAVGDSLDLTRFMDLLSAEAETMRRLGDTDTVNQRRAKAIGRLTDDTDQPALTYTTLIDDDSSTDDSSTDGTDAGSASSAVAAAGGEPVLGNPVLGNPVLGEPVIGVKPGRLVTAPGPFGRRRGLRVMAHVNLADLLALGLDPHELGLDGDGIASTDRLGQVLTTQLRDWITRHGSLASVTPVVDVNRTDAVDRHDPPEWMDTLVRLRDPHCVYPNCERSSWDADLDHIDPYLPPGEGGPPGQTRPENLAPLCRRHHLMKTHGHWRYRRTRDGTYIWTSQHGRTWLVTPQGTHDTTDNSDISETR